MKEGCGIPLGLVCVKVCGCCKLYILYNVYILVTIINKKPSF